MSLSDSVSTLDLGPAFLASDLSPDDDNSSALNIDIEMDPSPADYPITQASDDSDWNLMQDPSETDEVDTTHSATLLELAPVPLLDTLPDLDLLPNISNIESESNSAWSSGGSTLVEDDPENEYENVDWEAESARYSWVSSGEGQWEVISSEGHNALSIAEAMSSDDESRMDTSYSTPSTRRRRFTNRRPRQPTLREARRGNGYDELHIRDNSYGNNFEFSEASSSRVKAHAPSHPRYQTHRESEVELAHMNPLHCSGCNESHAASLFSPPQQSEHPMRRLCIGYEGYYTVCPHLRLSYANIRDWAAKGQGHGSGYTVECEDPFCHFYDAKIRYRRSETYGDEIIVMWSAFPEARETRRYRSPQDKFLDDCVAKLTDIYTYCPGAFCPHLQMSFQEAVNLNGLRESATPRDWVCLTGTFVRWAMDLSLSSIESEFCRERQRQIPTGLAHWIQIVIGCRDDNCYEWFIGT
ncbi:unnamed protein product [Clonostachys solani]|uniref:Uncharacterized protein n=1 Tax=Clonostachys solani TaxID=160281 RepID=A0A9N9ZIM3_9HYPO|nr:unnamed protein product [Clonostachys solani]